MDFSEVLLGLIVVVVVNVVLIVDGICVVTKAKMIKNKWETSMINLKMLTWNKLIKVVL